MGRYLNSRKMHHSGSTWVLVQDCCTPTPGPGMRFLHGPRPKNEPRGVHLWANWGLVMRGMRQCTTGGHCTVGPCPMKHGSQKEGSHERTTLQYLLLKMQIGESHQALVKPNVTFPSSVLFLLPEPLAFFEHLSEGCCELSLFELSRCWIYLWGSLILS